VSFDVLGNAGVFQGKEWLVYYGAVIDYDFKQAFCGFQAVAAQGT
jgi:hypothetical protein